MKSPPMAPIQAQNKIYAEPIVGPFRGRRGLLIAGTDALRHAILTQVPDSQQDALVLLFHI